MKLSRYALCLVPGLALVLSSQAQPLTEFDWTFSVAGRTNAPTVATNNPFAATATATVIGDFDTYYFGTVPGGLFGTQTGLWDIASASGHAGKVELGVSLGALVAVEFTISFVQFIDVNGLYPGIVSFSSPNIPGFTTGTALTPTRTVVEQQTGDMVGYWVRDTYKWNAMGAPGPMVLDLAPGTNGFGAILLSEVDLAIKGDLTSTPEPGSLALLGVGLVGFAARSWSRRRIKE